MVMFLNHFRGAIAGAFVTQIGWTCLSLFFMLSGFLLTKLLVTEYRQNNSISLVNYFIRRILRIWPLYFLYMILIVVASFLLSGYPLDLSRLFGSLFFYDNVLTAASGKFNPNFATLHLWSISLEEQYYLLLPFLVPWLLRMSKKKIILFFTVAFLLLFVARFFISILHLNYAYAYVLPLSGDSFLVGVFLGLGIFETGIKKINPLFALVVGIVLLISLYFFPFRTVANNGWVMIATYFIPAVAFFFIFIDVVYNEKGIIYKFLSNKILRYLGKISFGLYVFHMLANIITYHIFYLINEPLDIRSFLLALLITIVLAVLSYELIEKRFLKLKSRFTVIKSREV